MKLLFVIDPPANLNPKKDSTIALMCAAHRRGDTVFAVCINALALIDGGAKFIAERFDISEEDKPWFQRDAAKLLPAEFFDAVLMRLEPPINAAFMEATLFLDHVAVPVFNAPRALRELNEKLAILSFSRMDTADRCQCRFPNTLGFSPSTRRRRYQTFGRHGRAGRCGVAGRRQKFARPD